MCFLNLSSGIIQIGLVAVFTGFLPSVSNMFQREDPSERKPGQHVGEAPLGGGNQGVGMAIRRKPSKGGPPF